MNNNNIHSVRRKPKLEVVKDEIDPNLTMSIYIGDTNRNIEMAKLGWDICDEIKSNNKGREEKSLPAINIGITGVVTMDTFNNCLNLYEKYQDNYKSDISNSNTISLLEFLEDWFCKIVEPKPKHLDEMDEWNKREYSRIKGLSDYCHPVVKEVLILKKARSIGSKHITRVK